MLNGSAFALQWQHLNNWLAAHREFWQPRPFTEPAPGWTRRWPELASHVSAFTDEQCLAFDSDPSALARELGDLLASLPERERLTALPELVSNASAEACTLPEVRARDMPGRKRQQAGAFAATLRPLHSPVLDWCCGKGHLARTLRPLCDHAISGFEWDPLLVSDGNRLAQKFNDAVTVMQQDVMADDLTLPGDGHAVALHACGDLHRRLIRKAAQQGLPRLSVAPCCFHLSRAGNHQPLSRLAGQWRECLQVTGADLKLAVEEMVTAPARVRSQVQMVRQWRLAFDGLQRQLRGVDDYLPVPSHPGWVARGNFVGFCRWAADKKQLTLPASVDYAAWEAHGIQRLAQVRRHELVRHLFRRPLELWLVLDYAIFLEEQGYEVRLGTFCDRSLTPRNLLIDATLSHGSRQGLR